MLNSTKELHDATREILDLYEKASELTIYAETLGEKGLTALQYQLKDSFSHFMRAYRSELEGKTEEIIFEIKSTRNHLMRVIYDAGEICALSVLRKLEKTFNRISKNILTISCPQYFSEIKPKIEEYKQTIVKWKTEKTASDVKMCSNVYNTVVEIVEFNKLKVEASKYVAKDDLKAKIWNLSKWAIGIIIGSGIGILISLLF